MCAPCTAKYIVANWKMHKTADQACEFIEALIPAVCASTDHIFIAAPFTVLRMCAQKAEKSKVSLGAQNCSQYDEGPFTGEISASMVKDSGAKFAILGHSERRIHFGESSEIVNKKLHKALAAKLKVIVCVGETLDDYNLGRTKQVLSEQIDKSLADVKSDCLDSIIVAYEPVWAIGTGLVAKAETIEDVHAFCQEKLTLLAKQGGYKKKIPILYGGSVNADNAFALLKIPRVDGLLIGSASLNCDSFVKIATCNAGKSATLA